LFEDFDWKQFWEPSESFGKEYVGKSPTPEVIAAVETTLGYKLPASYVELAQHQNGGLVRKSNHRTRERTSWAKDHVAITGIFSIGSEKAYSLCGKSGSTFWSKEWGYPKIGIYFADCPSAGHDLLCLDYRECGPRGEPKVVHVDQEWDYKITFVAENFESFVRNLAGDEEFEQ